MLNHLIWHRGHLSRLWSAQTAPGIQMDPHRHWVVTTCWSFSLSACQPVSLFLLVAWKCTTAINEVAKLRTSAWRQSFRWLRLKHPKSGETFVTFVGTQATQAGDISLSLAPSMQNHKARHWSLELPGAKSFALELPGANTFCRPVMPCSETSWQFQLLEGSWSFRDSGWFRFRESTWVNAAMDLAWLSWLSNISSWRHFNFTHLTRGASTGMSWYQQWKDMNRSKPQKIHSYPVFTCLQLHSYANARHPCPWHDRNPAELANRVTFAAMSHLIFTSLPNFQPLKNSVLKTWAKFEKSSTRFTVHIQAIKGLAI